MSTQTKKIFLSLIFILSITFPSGLRAFAVPTMANAVIQPTEINSAIVRGFDYIKSQMNSDGGIRWFDETSSAAATLKVVIALAAAGYPQSHLMSDAGNTPMDYLNREGMVWVNQEDTETPGFNVARAGQLLIAIAAANQNPRKFGLDTIDLVHEINSKYDRGSAVFGTASKENITDQVWAILGLTANNASVPVEAVDWLASVQAPDGSWNDGFGSFLDTTPPGIMALVGSGVFDIESSTVQSAIQFMKENQQPDGGWQTEWDTDTNANTTGVMLQVISALEQTPTDDVWQQEEADPLSALVAVQQENGAFGGEFANAYSTADAIIGLTNQNPTSLSYIKSASNAFDFILSLQDTPGGWGSVGQTIDVILALRAAGWQPNSVMSEVGTPLEYIAANLQDYLEAGPDAIGKAVIGVIAGGMDPTDFYGTDLTLRLLDSYDETAKAFGSPDNTWHQAFGILGFHAADLAIPPGAVESLVNLQKEDGGWEYAPGLGTSVDNTAIAMQALLSSGILPEDEVVVNAMNYFRTKQADDGAWGDSSSTAFAIMAGNLLGESGNTWESKSGKSALSSLLSYQKQNGSFVYSWDYPDDNIMATASAMLALFGEDYIIQKSENTPKEYAAIVIDPGDAEVQTACVEVSEPSISGYELLDASGFEYTIEEGFTKSIMGVTNQDGETNYWSYWYWDGRDWMFQSVGASNTNVVPGTIEAWHFTSWELYPSLPSEFVPDFNDICGIAKLVNFQEQPYLDFNNFDRLSQDADTGVMTDDLEQNSMPLEQDQILSNEHATDAVEESLSHSDQQDDTISTPGKTTPDKEPETRSPLPLFIIGVVGIILFSILLISFLRKQK